MKGGSSGSMLPNSCCRIAVRPSGCVRVVCIFVGGRLGMHVPLSVRKPTTYLPRLVVLVHQLLGALPLLEQLRSKRVVKLTSQHLFLFRLAGLLLLFSHVCLRQRAWQELSLCGSSLQWRLEVLC